MIDILPATKEDAEKFYGAMPMKSFKGFVARDGDEVIGIGGVYYDEHGMVAFSEMKPEMKKHKKAIARGIRLILDVCDSFNAPVYAVPNKNEPTAQYLLIRCGFIPTGVMGPDGEVMVRSKS